MIKNLKTKIMQCLFLLVGTMTLLTSCHKDDDVEPAPAPTPEVAKPTTYTIMMYGCAGGNLDTGMEYKLSQVEAHGKTDRINFAGLVKFSKSRQNDATTEGTRLFTLTNEGMKNEKVHDANYRMDNPAHLAQFIKDTKEKMPADKYILIFWNHGQEFGLSDKLPADADYTEQPGSRSILFDDNVGKESLSIYEMEKGIKDSDTKMDLIYMDACNMGMAEVNYQLKDCTKYLMASASQTLDISANYSELMEALQTNDSLEDAIKEYVPYFVKNWQEVNVDGAVEDLECYDLSYMDEFAGYLKGAVSEFKNQVKDARERQKELDAVYDGVVCADDYGMLMGQTEYLHVFDGNGISVDVCSAFNCIASFTRNGVMANYVMQMKRTLDKMTVARASCNLPSGLNNVSMGLVWPTNIVVDILDTESYRLADNLKNAALYQATGWGDLLLNLNNPCTCKVTSPQGNEIYVLDEYSYGSDYTWQYDMEIDLSDIKDEEDIQTIELWRQTQVNSWNSEAEKHPVGLYLGKFVLCEAKDDFLEGYTCSLFTKKGVKKLKLKAYVKGGGDPDDPYLENFPAEIVEEIDLSEYTPNK